MKKITLNIIQIVQQSSTRTNFTRMATPEMWKVLQTFVRRYKTHTNLPWSVSALRQNIKMLPISSKDKFSRQLTSVLLLIHTLYCLLLLGWCWARSSQNNLSLGQIFAALFCFIVPSCFLAMPFVLSFTPHVIPTILNTITGFQNKMRGNRDEN